MLRATTRISALPRPPFPFGDSSCIEFLHFDAYRRRVCRRCIGLISVIACGHAFRLFLDGIGGFHWRAPLSADGSTVAQSYNYLMSAPVRQYSVRQYAIGVYMAYWLTGELDIQPEGKRDYCTRTGAVGALGFTNSPGTAAHAFCTDSSSCSCRARTHGE